MIVTSALAQRCRVWVAHGFLLTFAVLWFSSMDAFVASRCSWRFNKGVLVLFTAGNLLPQQIIVQPLFQIQAGAAVRWASTET